MANKSLGRGLSALFGEENLDPAVPPTSAEPIRPKTDSAICRSDALSRTAHSHAGPLMKRHCRSWKTAFARMAFSRRLRFGRATMDIIRL